MPQTLFHVLFKHAHFRHPTVADTVADTVVDTVVEPVAKIVADTVAAVSHSL